MVSASPLSLLYLCIIVSRLEVNNEYHTAWSPVLTEICAVVVLVAFLVRNHDWQFIHLSIDLLGASQAVVKHHYVYGLNIFTGYFFRFASLIPCSEMCGRFSVNFLKIVSITEYRYFSPLNC